MEIRLLSKDNARDSTEELSSGKGMTRKGWLISVGAMILAFLTSQHHNLHMLLISFGLGGAWSSPLIGNPLVRSAMLLMSLAMVAVIGYQILNAKRPRSMRLTGAISIIITLGLAAWSIMKFGW